MRQFVKFVISTITFLGCLQGALSAQALTYQFNWTGDSNYSVTGDFGFNDANNDGFARSNEFGTFNITFRDNLGSPLQSYDLNALQNFTNPVFNFNYDIVNNLVLQTGNSNATDGFAIGDADFGFVINSSAGSGITFTNSDSSIFDSSNAGNFTPTVVPFEFSPTLSVGILGAAFAIRTGYKRLKTRTIPQREQ